MSHSKTYDQNGIYQTIVDLTYLDCNQLWKDQFITKNNMTNDDTKGTIKRKIDDVVEVENTPVNESLKKRKVSIVENESNTVIHTYSNSIDK